jgi:hypothetical protein
VTECHPQGLRSIVGGLVLPLRIDGMARVVAVIIMIDMHRVRLVVLHLILGGQQYCSMLSGICVACMVRIPVSHVQVS